MALTCMVVPFLPASNLLFRVGFVIAERVLYLPSIGYVMLVILGLKRLISISRHKWVSNGKCICSNNDTDMPLYQPLYIQNYC